MHKPAVLATSPRNPHEQDAERCESAKCIFFDGRLRREVQPGFLKDHDMDITMHRPKRITFGQKTKELVIDTAAYLFILLFLYTAYAKFSDLEAFEKTLSGLALVGGAAPFISWAIPTAETAVAGLLIVPRLRMAGLKASLVLMILFTAYLVYIVLTASSLPCNCGGVISSLSWNEHIFFNAGFIALAAVVLLFNKQRHH